MSKSCFSLSANIENGLAEGTQYIITPNVKKVAKELMDGYLSGIHSFSIIGTYGTGKSSFLLNLENDLTKNAKSISLINPEIISNGNFTIINILGDYRPLSELINEKLGGENGGNSLQLLKSFYEKESKEGRFLFVAIDEFGKVLEYASKHDPDKEIYYFQKLAEFVNFPTRNIILVTTLHQNFSSYSGKLTQVQKNEWSKVKGRFQEIVFAEPIEHLLFLAAEHIIQHQEKPKDESGIIKLHQLASSCKYISSSFDVKTALRLYPLDPFSAYSITKAIQKFGQNERSLFSFLNSQGEFSITKFSPNEHLTYNLAVVFDYINNTFNSYLSEANSDALLWNTIQMTIERVECIPWKEPELMIDAIKLVKSIGLINLFGNAGSTFSAPDMALYARKALEISNPEEIIHELKRLKIIRFAEYKQKLILFEGTDINLEEEIANATLIVPKPVQIIDELRTYFNARVCLARACYYHRGTPRYFEFVLSSVPEERVPTGDVDGFVEILISSKENTLSSLKDFSSQHKEAQVFALYSNPEDIIEHLHNIKKYEYIIEKVLIDKSDRVALREMSALLEYEKSILNKTLNDHLFSFGNNFSWVFNGKEIDIHSQKDFNILLSAVCEEIYYKTPIICNELINKNKISASISAAKAKYLQALISNSDKEDFGFEVDKFPPEKTIYYSLLKNTGLHINGEFQEQPSNPDIHFLWEACEEFLHSSSDKPKKISELIKLLSNKPYKIKDGVLDFWIPTYLFIKRQEYSLYGGNGQYIPTINIELFDLMKKHIGEFKVKAYAVDGIKLQLFNQYRRFLNLEENSQVNSGSFIETIKPFIFFYNKQLNDYAKHTQKLDHKETAKFRDVLANAKDPEKAFLEDLPEALGFDDIKLSDPVCVQTYCQQIQQAVRDLRDCYHQLIDRIENRLVESLGLSSFDYSEYYQEIQIRLSGINPNILTPRLKEFYQHVISQFDKRVEWYQSICYAILSTPLEKIRDDQEEKLLDDMIFLFRECEKQAVISKSIKYTITDKEEAKSTEIENKVNKVLSGNRDLDVYTLIRVLQKMMN